MNDLMRIMAERVGDVDSTILGFGTCRASGFSRRSVVGRQKTLPHRHRY
jgi:hypothetical protein